ncbi:MAG: FHA domain-containing protein [Pseudanabaenaceae cyanobacterium bins.39]|nr:FHA domain-containing protein [Pseudanabaenaceae cyanobacterium bins.39]
MPHNNLHQNLHETEISVNLSSEPILVVTDNSGTRKVPLVEDQYTIGREADNVIHLDSDFVSRYHAHLVRVNDSHHGHTFRIIDGSISGKPSKNGLVVNALHSVLSYDLKDGDIVTFAPEVHILYLAASK